MFFWKQAQTWLEGSKKRKEERQSIIAGLFEQDVAWEDIYNIDEWTQYNLEKCLYYYKLANYQHSYRTKNVLLNS